MGEVLEFRTRARRGAPAGAHGRQTITAAELARREADPESFHTARSLAHLLADEAERLGAHTTVFLLEGRFVVAVAAIVGGPIELLAVPFDAQRPEKPPPAARQRRRGSNHRSGAPLHGT